MSNWQLMETAPRDGSPFLIKKDNCIFAAFYKKNKHPHAKHSETLQIITRPNRFASAEGYFSPTFWALIPE